MTGWIRRALRTGVRRRHTLRPGNVTDVTAVLLVPERHLVWEAGRLWDLLHVDSTSLTVVMGLASGADRLDLPVLYDQEVPVIDTRPGSDAVDAVTLRVRS